MICINLNNKLYIVNEEFPDFNRLDLMKKVGELLKTKKDEEVNDE